MSGSFTPPGPPPGPYAGQPGPYAGQPGPYAAQPAPYAARPAEWVPAYGPGPLPAATPPPPADLPFHLLLLRGRAGWGWPFLGLLTAVVGFLAFQAIEGVGFAVYWAARGLSADAISNIVKADPATPSYLALLNLSLGSLVLIGPLTIWAVHSLRPGWAVSVVGRIRWRWLLVSFGIALVALIATVVVSTLVPSQGDGTELNGSVNDFTSTTRDFLIVIVLLTPLQAAGEEFGFRGYLTQAVGRVFAGNRQVATALAVVVPAVLFALAHGAQDGPVFVDRFAFGLVAGVLVIATGGLEAGIAMHVLNNFLAFGLALAFGDMTTALKPGDGSWWSLPVTLTQSLVFTGLTILVARRMGIATHTEDVVPGRRGDNALEPENARV